MKKIILIMFLMSSVYAADTSAPSVESSKELSPAEKFNALVAPKDPVSPFANVHNIINQKKNLESTVSNPTRKEPSNIHNTYNTSLQSMSVLKDLSIDEINVQKYQGVPLPTFQRLIPDDILK